MANNIDKTGMTQSECLWCHEKIWDTGTEYLEHTQDTGWVDDRSIAPNYCPETSGAHQPGSLPTAAAELTQGVTEVFGKPKVKSAAARKVFGDR